MKGMMMNNCDIKINSIWKRNYYHNGNNIGFFIIVIDILNDIVRFKILDDDTDIYSKFLHEFIRDYTHVQ